MFPWFSDVFRWFCSKGKAVFPWKEKAVEDWMASLPEELLYEILLLFPAIELIELKLVCKPWFRLITNPDFVESHLRRGISQSGLVFMEKSWEDCEFYYLSFDSSEARARKLDLVKCLRDNHRVTYSQVDCDLLDSFHGLLLFGITSKGASNWTTNLLIRNPTNLLVWNPVTGSSILVPACPRRDRSLKDYYNNDKDYWRIYIAYDPSVRRYKLVSISCTHLPGRVFMDCYVVELFRGQQPFAPWKELTIPPESRIGRVKGSVYTEGKVHWLVQMKDRWLQLWTLDLATNKFKVVDCPHRPFLQDRFYFFFEFNGKFFGSRSKNAVELWMLEDFEKPKWSSMPPFSTYMAPIPLDLPVTLRSKFIILRPPRWEIAYAWYEELALAWRTIPLLSFSFNDTFCMEHFSSRPCVTHSNTLVSPVS